MCTQNTAIDATRHTFAISTGKADDTDVETHTWENIQTAVTLTQATPKKVAAQAILDATLQNEHGKGEEEGEERIGGIQKGKQQSPVPLLKPSGNTSPKRAEPMSQARTPKTLPTIHIDTKILHAYIFSLIMIKSP